MIFSHIISSTGKGCGREDSGGNLEGTVFFIRKAKGCQGRVLAVIALCVCVHVCVCMAMLIDLVYRNKLTSTKPFLT